MSRTRSEGGATVVRLDAITPLPAFLSVVQISKSDIPVRPRLSLFLKESIVNGNSEVRALERDRRAGEGIPERYSSPKSSFASSTKLMRTTMLDPARPMKNMTSRRRIPKIARDMGRL